MNNISNVPITLTSLFRSLFGEYNYGELPESFEDIEFSDWKKDMKKIVKSIKKACIINIDTGDRAHIEKIVGLCSDFEGQITEAKNHNEINLIMIEFLTMTLFMILGHIPQNDRVRRINNINQWKLDKYRKIVYTQTLKQKINVILDLYDHSEYNNRIPDRKFMMEKYRNDFNNDDRKFIEWFKYEYASVYLELF